MFSSSPADAAFQFAIPPAVTNLVTGSIFGTDAPVLFGEKTEPAAVRAFFAQIPVSVYSTQPAAQSSAAETTAIAGVSFKLLGGNQTVSLQRSGPSFGSSSAGLFNNAGQAPALFAFYNFPQLAEPGDTNQLAANQLPDNANSNLTVPLQNGVLQSLGALSFPITQAPGTAAFNGIVPNSQAVTVQLHFPLVFSAVKGSVRFSGQTLTDVEPNSLATQIFGPAFATSAARKYNALGGGVTLALPLFDRKATVSLDGLYESLKRNDKTSFLYAASSGFSAPNSTALPSGAALSASFDPTTGPAALFFYPNYVDVRRTSGGASLAFPVGKALTVNTGYREQHYDGEALTTLTQDLSQGSRSISGGLVYNIPKTNSSIDLFFNRYQYFDDLVPSSNRTENRQNIYFSVKF